jgi:flavodoxin I
VYQVLYYSRGGNTRKLAEVIAGELGVMACDIRHSSPDPNAKVILIGSGIYGAKPGDDMERFVGMNDFRGRKVAIFSTSWRTGESGFEGIATALRRKGAVVLQGYHCKGRAGIFNLGHPNKNELDGARAYAREMVKAG